MDQRFDVLIIGAGVVGSAAARELARYQLKIGVLEKTPDVCCGTCARGCPGGAIHDPKGEKARIAVDFGERQIYYGDVQMGRCTLFHHGMNNECSPFLKKEFPNMAFDVRSSQMTEEAYIFAYSLAGAKWGRTPGSHAVMDYYNYIIDHTGCIAICGARGVIRFNERCTAVCTVR